MVDARRSLLTERENVELISYRERRYFLDADQLIPASLVRYELHSRANDIVVVMTVLTERSVIEVIGHTSDPSRESELQSLVTSVHVSSMVARP
jgi:hypothetical protein